MPGPRRKVKLLNWSRPIIFILRGLVDFNYFIFCQIRSCLFPSNNPIFEKSMAEDFKMSSVVIFYSVSFISMQ
jgi:hypothetical protein